MKDILFNIFKVLPLCLVSLVGVFIFTLLNLPLPWLIGSIFSSALITVFTKFPLYRPELLSIPARIILGLAVASSFKPELIPYLGQYIISIALIVPFVLLVAFFGTWYYIRVAKMDVMTAFFSTMPGGLLEMITLGEANGANTRVISLIQSARLLMIICILPFILEYFLKISLSETIKSSNSIINMPIRDFIILSIAGTIGWYLADKIKLAGSVMLGAMFGGIVVYATGIVTTKIPDEFILFSQLILGTMVGSSFVGASRYELLLTLRATSGFFVVLSLISAAFMAIAHYIVDIDLVSAILAFSPGGQTEMMIIAMVIASNIPYIALHHMFRIFLIMAITPVIAKYLKRR